MMRWSTRSLEFQNGWSAFLVGLTLLLPVSTFSTSSTLTELEHFFPECAWGALFTILGSAQLYATYYDRVMVRRITASLLGILFALYSLTLFVINPASFGAAFVFPMALGQAWAFFQARRVP